jgi:hypothetical protein
MARTSKDKAAELFPDAWDRFKRAVQIVAKSPPQHRTKKAKSAVAKKKAKRAR